MVSKNSYYKITVFNPNNKEELSFRECLAPAMEITHPDDAKQYLEKYTAYIQKTLNANPRNDSLSAVEIAKINLEYYRGYYNAETQNRVAVLFLNQGK